MIQSKKNESKSDLTAKDIRLLAAIGFVSARSGLAEQSRKIFEGLSIARPESTFPYIGLALTNLCIGTPETAVDILKERGLKAVPNDPELRTWLAIAFHYSGQVINARQVCEKLQNECEGADVLNTLNKVLSRYFNDAPHIYSPHSCGRAQLAVAAK